MLAKQHPEHLANLIEDTWKQANDESWSFGPPGILSAWHVMDVFRGLDSADERDAWASILSNWITSRGPMAEFATEHLHDVASLTDETVQPLLTTLSDGKRPEDAEVLVKLLWHSKEDENYIRTAVNLLERALERDTELFSRLSSHFKVDVCYRSTGRTIGQPSPVDLQSKQELQEVISEKSRPPEVDVVLRDAINAIEKHIENDMREDEELLKER